MTVYIDEFRDYGRRIGVSGPFWCHMMADSHDELVAFARSIGFKDQWIQKPGTAWEHYDIGTKGKLELARKKGAVEISCRELSEKMGEKVRAMKEATRDE